MGLKSTIFVAIGALLLGNYYLKNKSSEPSPIVDTFHGKVQGIVAESRDGKPFYSFRGIPYAKPPVGQLRYESPQETASWANIRKVEQFGNECSQFNIFEKKYAGDENCLFLNVYTPKSGLDGKKQLPVMVFIHGGLFVFGSGNMYGPEYFMDEDIVLVTINYRLSSFGFLNTGDGVVRGNMGLKDQAFALKWVQKNIKNFGGNPDQVTIFGESAGGASVHLQVLSPTTKGLFHRAISQSGVAFNPWVLHGDPAEQVKRHATKLKCNRKTTEEMVKCLKGVRAEDILFAQADSLEMFREPITLFSPTIESVRDDKAFLPEHPREILKAGKHNKVPFIIGYNSHEGLLTAPEIIRNETTSRIFNKDFVKVMPDFIFYPKTDAKHTQEMAEIREYYFGKNVNIDSPSYLQNYVSLITDYVWAVGIQDSINLHAAHGQTFSYYYSYPGQFELGNLLLAMKGEYHPVVEFLIHKFKQVYNKYVLGQEPVHLGTGHGDELAVMFHMSILKEYKKGHPDYNMSKELVKLWVSFAKDEKTLKFKNMAWPAVEKGSTKPLKFLHINNNSPPTFDQEPNQKRIDFLSKYYQKYAK